MSQSLSCRRADARLRFARLVPVFRTAALAALIAILAPVLAPAQPAVPDPDQVLESLRVEHPRLILTDGRLNALKQTMESDATLRRYCEDVIASADQALDRPALRHRLVGPRLLSVSRDCLRRTYALGLAWRLTDEEKYADALEEALLTVCRFPDWNPSHFLDTAEMSHAVAIGYDWLFDRLSPESRDEIRRALLTLGLNEALGGYLEFDEDGFAESRLGDNKTFWWARSAFNWNQVCNSGLAIAALAVADTDPGYARILVPGAVKNLPIAMAQYAPDGAWPEGPAYWNYATRYNIYGISALETALGTDFGLSDVPGFDAAGTFPIYGAGPTGRFYNFADANMSSRLTSEPTLFWLGRKFDNPTFVAIQHRQLATRSADPFDVIWYAPAPEETPSLDLDRKFSGSVEMAVFRSAWDDPEALFLAGKAGYNQVAHGNLDLGSFIFEALGVRWAVDLGADDYNMPGYFQMGEDGLRWNYYRMNSQSHNLVLIDNESQNIRASSRFLKYKSTADSGAVVIDLQETYPEKTSRNQRGLQLRRDLSLALVQDEIELTGTSDLTWGMTTNAEIELDDARARLTREGKALEAIVLAPSDGRFSVSSAEQEPPQAKNEGFRRLEVKLKEQTGSIRIVVALRPAPEKDAEGEALPEIMALGEW